MLETDKDMDGWKMIRISLIIILAFSSLTNKKHAQLLVMLEWLKTSKKNLLSFGVESLSSRPSHA